MEGDEALNNMIVHLLMLYEAYALCLQILQGLKLTDSFNQDSDTQHCYFLLVTASHRFTLMNFNASKQ